VNDAQLIMHARICYLHSHQRGYRVKAPWERMSTSFDATRQLDDVHLTFNTSHIISNLEHTSMVVRYCCSHLEDPQASLPPSYPSSSSSYHPLPSLYFCEECDAIRCNLCVGIEIASYFCPNCLFDVPSASVRADRNR